MAELQRLADVAVINVDTPENSRALKGYTKIRVPVLLDPGLDVTTKFDMQSRDGLPMGGMRGVPTMGYVIFDPGGIVRAQRAYLYFGADADHMLEVLRQG